nr:macrophage mannose receptor 1-like [Lytechinus pictus]
MCYPGWRIHDGYCYQLVSSSPTTWDDAKDKCEAQGSTLLTIKNEKEQEFINEQLPVLWQNGIPSIWLGISDTLKDGEMKWTDGTAYDDLAYQNWPAGNKPANREGEQQCGSIYTGSSVGQWDYGDCFNLFDYTSTGYCPADWYIYNDHCYFMEETGVTYTDAQQNCNDKGGKLASIHTTEEMSFIELHLQANDYYVGLERKGAGINDFQWTDGTQFDYHNWDIGEPNDAGSNEDCVHVRGPYTTPSGVWNDVSCNRKYASICKKKADESTPPPPTNPPDVGCYEPFQQYKGNAIVTVDGNLCYNWKDANREYNPIDYPDKDLTENYCRNPNNAAKPWCYIEFGFQDCDVPQCNAPVDCYEGDGYVYRGKYDKTENGSTCLPWASLDDSAYFNPRSFPEEGLEGNYCRNPAGSGNGPWCYYNKKAEGYAYSYCGIPKCNTTGCYEGNGANYRGSANEGENGQTCVKWEEATSRPYNPTTYPNAGLDHNYCRNPSQDDEPWCYVRDDNQGLVQEPCLVPHCTIEVGCYVGKGMSYRGHANYISLGRTCSDWVNFIDEFYPVPLSEFTMQPLKSILPVAPSISDISLSECAHECLHRADFFCKSFNYHTASGGSDRSRCLLSAKNSKDVELGYDPEQDYYERNQTYGLEENYCRNPNGAMGPWCYFWDPIHNQTDWSYCSVPECNPEDVGCYDPRVRGTTYRGPARTTASGHICVEWKDTYWIPDNYPNAGLDENYCRNPSVFIADAPFCMYKAAHNEQGYMRELCDIPQCNVQEACGGEGWRADPSEEWCYKIEQDSTLSFDEAQQACEGEDANLLSILSEAESNLIVGMISLSPVEGFWIGANDRFQEAGWEWTDASPFSYLNWQPGQPDNLQGIEECVYMARGNGMWSDEKCDLTFPYICKKRSKNVIGSSVAPTTLAPGSLCPTDWEGYGSHCYLVQRDFVSWTKARASCDLLDAKLATIHSEGEMTHIAGLLSRGMIARSNS